MVSTQTLRVNQRRRQIWQLTGTHEKKVPIDSIGVAADYQIHELRRSSLVPGTTVTVSNEDSYYNVKLYRQIKVSPTRLY